MKDFLLAIGWKDWIEIIILWFLIYQAYLYFRSTRAARILTGLLVVIATLILVSYGLQLQVIPYLISKLSIFLALALVVLFQPELRKAFAELGSQRLFFSLGNSDTEVIKPIANAISQLSSKHFGALIAIERRIELTDLAQTGVTLKADISPELLLSIFQHKTSLHDGGVIIRGDKIHSASCVFPVSQKESLDRSLGLRHRAGLGITEETDAIAIIVSEETGEISIAEDGKLEKDIARSDVEAKLEQILGENEMSDEKDDTTKTPENQD